ncbi:unnamed protein product [Polarella glacialis]|uniref:Uncharacterized protein n=1 Tax=Polarella glacialis TaxID=89957 RepID=A0A813KR07_POLGL|nr:unnamed protein product [Polarella glacialis]
MAAVEDALFKTGGELGQLLTWSSLKQLAATSSGFRRHLKSSFWSDLQACCKALEKASASTDTKQCIALHTGYCGSCGCVHTWTDYEPEEKNGPRHKFSLCIPPLHILDFGSHRVSLAYRAMLYMRCPFFSTWEIVTSAMGMGPHPADPWLLGPRPRHNSNEEGAQLEIDARLQFWFASGGQTSNAEITLQDWKQWARKCRGPCPKWCELRWPLVIERIRNDCKIDDVFFKSQLIQMACRTLKCIFWQMPSCYSSLVGWVDEILEDLHESHAVRELVHIERTLSRCNAADSPVARVFTQLLFFENADFNDSLRVANDFGKALLVDVENSFHHEFEEKAKHARCLRYRGFEVKTPSHECRRRLVIWLPSPARDASKQLDR